MRYFLETIDGDQVDNPDLEHGCCNYENINFTCEYEVITPAVTHVKVLNEYPNGGKEVQTIIDEEEVGKWHLYDNRGGVRREFEDDDVHIPSDFNKHEVHTSICSVGIYHAYTPEEQEEYDRQKAENEQKRQDAIIRDGMFAQMLSDQKSENTYTYLTEFQADTDNAICDLYELIPEQVKNKQNSQHRAICKAYARRILRGEITINDVPEELRQEVQDILDGK